MIDLLDPNNASAAANLILLLTLVLLSTVLFICFSGFVKYSIVLNIIKNAVGTQQIPPSIVVNLLAALMAMNAIWPYLAPGLDRIKPFFYEETEHAYNQYEGLGKESVADQDMYQLVTNIFDYFPELLTRVTERAEDLDDKVDIPIKFQAGNEILKLFIGNLIIDMYQGFELGLKLYLVFVSIDFLIAVILSGAGMTMLSPTVISTPIKLAIFYFSDSWTMLFKIMA
ncbi:EscR/YscR/HrcR family type III secretion system export apparatus protein [Vibrio coralliilyticus]|uniref:EscR/YscR/HrcR family type III secretion system export apparatus protein n=1 Tax=Vibrio coralliilyticus TaxID=190893 RepID=UPI0017A8F2E1|nr:EscR/YscR/HrcR family type III secretion system export apparatus protein [Vibrio coralliilyticus]NUW68081.1 EscR/YscR/HrcR family type III secretion system export apparatus protein [Vibrio coralliilyticus]